MRLEAVLRALKSKRAKKADRMARYRLLAARSDGASLRDLAGLLGIHVLTLCRWQRRHPVIKAALGEAAPRRAKAAKGERPSVNVHGACPLCKARAMARKAGAVPFWRCARWPSCGWSSWRPTAPAQLPPVQGTEVLVALAAERRLRAVRAANGAALIECASLSVFRLKPLAFVSRTRGFRGGMPAETGETLPIPAPDAHCVRRLHIGACRSWITSCAKMICGDVAESPMF